MPLKKGSQYRPSVRVWLFIGCVALWIVLELIIERFDISVFIPQFGRDQRMEENGFEINTKKSNFIEFINKKQSEKKIINVQFKDQLKDGATFYSGYLVNTNGCRIPDLDPMDESIRKFIYSETEIDCTVKYGPALVESNLTAVYVNESVLTYYNLTELGQISCCYRPFWREEKKRNPSGVYPSDVDSIVRFAEDCIPFSGSATINYEFVKIECFVGNDSVYKDYFTFFPKQPSKIEKETDVKDNVNVLIYGMDAVSRLNFYRQMPQTLKFLKKTLGAVEMLGYNKVEDNTFPNVLPVLTGLTDQELTKVCWHKSYHVFDDCKFIWDDFSSLGYKTAFGEDASWMGIFKFLKRGFRKQPTHYYMRIFNYVAEKDIGFDHRVNANLCVGPRKNYETLINYASKFFITMKDVLKFAFFWEASLSHDYLNLPKYGDEDHKRFLEILYNQGIFNNTFMVFMSDHGIRYGDIRKTYQGYMEERLPSMFIIYPQWFGNKYTTAVSNLKKNMRKLTTAFDLHELLKDLTNLTQLEKEVLRVRSEVLNNAKVLPRGISWFLPISGNRTCSDAGITDHWCTCHESKDIATNNLLVTKSADHLVKQINYLLRDFPQCIVLKLTRILHAREERSISHRTFESSNSGIRDLSITIQVTPGNGLFEATVRYDGNRESLSVVGTISRINLYGEQSSCMPNYKLRLYCYCDHD